MSRLQCPLRGDSGAEGVVFRARWEACTAAVDALVPSDAAAGAAESFSLLKRIVSFPAMLGTMLVGAVFIAGQYFAVDPDLWWHIKNGQNILATHRWPTADPYSFTVAGTPWLSYEWLCDVLFWAVAPFAGVRGLDALLIVFGTAIVIALYIYATFRSR